MKTKEITINGKNYAIVFNVKTMMNFEEISGKSFFGEDFSHLKERIAIIIAAVLSANEKVTLTVEEIIEGEEYKSLQEIFAAYRAVMELAGEFFQVPEIEKQNEPELKEDDDKPKN
jgi:hypothetical protein